MKIKELGAIQTKNMVESNMFDLIIDLREDDLFEKWHIDKSMNIPMRKINDNILFLSTYINKNILLYC